MVDEVAVPPYLNFVDDPFSNRWLAFCFLVKPWPWVASLNPGELCFGYRVRQRCTFHERRVLGIEAHKHDYPVEVAEVAVVFFR